MSTRRDGEPDQGAAVGPVRRPDELPPAPGESVPVVAEFGGVRAGAGVASDGVGGDGAGAGAGGDDPPEVVQGGGAGGRQCASGGVSPGEQLPVSRGVSGGVWVCDGSAASGGRRVWLSERKRWSQRGLPTGGQGEGVRAEAGAPPRRPRISQEVLMCSQPKGDRRADEISGLAQRKGPVGGLLEPRLLPKL